MMLFGARKSYYYTLIYHFEVWIFWKSFQILLWSIWCFQEKIGTRKKYLYSLIDFLWLKVEFPKFVFVSFRFFLNVLGNWNSIFCLRVGAKPVRWNKFFKKCYFWVKLKLASKWNFRNYFLIQNQICKRNRLYTLMCTFFNLEAF